MGPRHRTSVSPFAYLERGRYEQHLEPWFAAFPMNLQWCSWRTCWTGTRHSVRFTQHLGVDPDFRPATREQLNQSTEPTSSLPPDLVGAHCARTSMTTTWH